MEKKILPEHHLDAPPSDASATFARQLAPTKGRCCCCCFAMLRLGSQRAGPVRATRSCAATWLWPATGGSRQIQTTARRRAPAVTDIISQHEPADTTSQLESASATSATELELLREPEAKPPANSTRPSASQEQTWRRLEKSLIEAYRAGAATTNPTDRADPVSAKAVSTNPTSRKAASKKAASKKSCVDESSAAGTCEPGHRRVQEVSQEGCCQARGQQSRGRERQQGQAIKDHQSLFHKESGKDGVG